MADKQACKLSDVTVLFIMEYNFTSSANNLRFTPDDTMLLIIYLFRLHGWLRNSFYAFLYFVFYSIYDVIDMM